MAPPPATTTTMISAMAQPGNPAVSSVFDSDPDVSEATEADSEAAEESVDSTVLPVSLLVVDSTEVPSVVEDDTVESEAAVDDEAVLVDDTVVEDLIVEEEEAAPSVKVSSNKPLQESPLLEVLESYSRLIESPFFTLMVSLKLKSLLSVTRPVLIGVDFRLFL